MSFCSFFICIFLGFVYYVYSGDEKMVIVVISARFKRILDIFAQYENYHLIKRVGPKLFYYVDGDTSHLISKTKKIILNILGVMTVFEVYNLYNGMIDFTAYLPNKKKDESSYYNSVKKDLSDEELENWKKENLNK